MKYLSIVVVSSVVALATPVHAADQDRDRVQTRDPLSHTSQSQDQVQSRDVDAQRVYGWELMSNQERTEHQMKMMSLKTEKEREAFQRDHHKKMQERAKAQGKTLPDMPQERGGPATSPWMGQGQGKGQGGGKP